MPDGNDRLTSLEERFMFLEQHLEQLDEVVRGIHDRLDDLRREISRVHDAVVQLGEPSEEDEDAPE